MKKFLGLFILLFMFIPSIANAYQSKYPLQQTQSNREYKVYSSSGSLEGYVKPVGKNTYKTYNKYHQVSGKYKQEGNRIKKYNRAGG